MHSLDSNVPAFLMKLWKLVGDTNSDDLISWSEAGNSFIIRDPATFAKQILPQYYKHNNMASFIRQLNMYGFRKLANFEKGGLKVENNEIEFYNPFFVKGKEKLDLIKRKIPGKVSAESSPSESSSQRADPKDILTDLTSIREKQEAMNNLLIGMKKENELLWREMSNLRQKHKTQEQIIQKVIQFLVSMVRSGKPNVGVKRPIARMIRNGQSTNSTAKSRQLDVVRPKTDLFISVPGEKSPAGPVILEVLDQEDGSIDSRGSQEVNLQGKRFSYTDSIGISLDSPVNESQSLDSLNLASPITNLKFSDEHILGIPSDLISADSMSVPDIATVLSVPETASSGASQSITAASASDQLSPEVSNVISIPEAACFVSIVNDVSNLISVPEGTDVISLLNSTPDQEKETSNTTLSTATKNCDSSMYSLVPFLSGPSGASNSAVLNDAMTSRLLSDVKTAGSAECKALQADILDAMSSFDTEIALFDSSVRERNLNKKDQLDEDVNFDVNALQLSLTDKPISAGSVLAKSAFSNHVHNVEENLDWLQTHMSSDGLNVDPSFLLTLFSPDGDVNNLAFDSQFGSENILRDTNVNVVGNELVQFNPSSLDVSSFDDDHFNQYLNLMDPRVEEKTSDGMLWKSLENIRKENVDAGSDEVDTDVSPSPRKKCKVKASRRKRSFK